MFVQKSILSTLSGFKQLLFFDTVFLAVENTLVDVAGTHNMDLASLLMLGNLGSFTFHQSNTLVLLPGGLSCKYMSISSLIVKEPLVSSGPSKMSKADFLTSYMLEYLHLVNL